MLKEVPLGEWMPDLAPSHSNHLVVAENVYPIANGYSPARDLVAFTDTLTLPPIGGGSFVNSVGTSVLIAAVNPGGGNVQLQKWSSGWTTMRTYPDADDTRVRFAQFGDNLVAVSGGAPVITDLISEADVPTTNAPTNCIDVARVRDFVMVLTDDDSAQWCQFNNSAVWTTGANQADYQPLLGGGEPVALVGGEYGIILQKQAIKRVTYVGSVNDIIFQFDEISPELGCMSQGSVCNIGRLIFFLSERGFEMCDGETVTPISDEKINRWFFNNFSRSDIDAMWSAIDPRAHQVMWSMPGNPGSIITYNWVLKRFTVLKIAHTAMFTGYSPGVSLEGVDAVYPSGLESVTESLDSPAFNGGNPVLLVVDTAWCFGSLAGDNLEAEVRQNNIELSSGTRSRLRVVRPVTDATDVQIAVNAKMRAGDGESLVAASSMRSNGKMPIRANGRYYDMILNIPAGADWSYVQGVEYEFEAGDGQ